MEVREIFEFVRQYPLGVKYHILLIDSLREGVLTNYRYVNNPAHYRLDFQVEDIADLKVYLINVEPITVTKVG